MPCSLCNSAFGNKRTCPLNSKCKHPDLSKHILDLKFALKKDASKAKSDSEKADVLRHSYKLLKHIWKKKPIIDKHILNLFGFSFLSVIT